MPALKTKRLFGDKIYDQHDVMRHIFGRQVDTIGLSMRGPIRTDIWTEVAALPAIAWIIIIGLVGFYAAVIFGLASGDPWALIVLLYELLN